MNVCLKHRFHHLGPALGLVLFSALPASAQLVDNTQSQNDLQAGIKKSLDQEYGAGRGDWMTPDSSSFLISRDPFRAIRRGRQLFQRKFIRAQGQGPRVNDGLGDLNTNLALGAGLSDSCAACHGRPRGAAGSGGDVATRPDSRDAPHLFGLGLKEMLADEITADLRAIRDDAQAEARRRGHKVKRKLESKGIDFGWITANPDGSVDTEEVEGVDPDLRVRPFFSHGGTISIREFVVGALRGEMGLEAVDQDLATAAAGGRVLTPSGMILDGSLDAIEAPPTSDPSADPDHDGIANEVPAALVDYLEFYLLNYFKPATDRETEQTRKGRKLFHRIGCASCHMAELTIDHDRRVANVETTFDAARGIFNRLYATATTLTVEKDDHSGYPTLKLPMGEPFVVENIFTDFKRHDLGSSFHERNYDGSLRTQFLTTPLWGVGTTAPYGHDGRSISLREVILRHGGEAAAARDKFAQLGDDGKQEAILAFLQSLVIFPPDDTASNLDPGDPSQPSFPQLGHGSIKLAVLFNDPGDGE
ncbi:MAG: di-heme oxidoredictase family protein [Planctomycetota bacterium]